MKGHIVAVKFLASVYEGAPQSRVTYYILVISYKPEADYFFEVIRGFLQQILLFPRMVQAVGYSQVDSVVGSFHIPFGLCE